MTGLAVVLGRFLGAMLAECAPVLVEVMADAIRKGLADTVEDGARRGDLRERLLRRLRQSRDHGSPGGAGAATGDGQAREGLGG